MQVPDQESTYERDRKRRAMLVVLAVLGFIVLAATLHLTGVLSPGS